MPKLAGARTFRRTDNATFLNRIRESASTTYQERVPQATQANLENTLDSIFAFDGIRNEFMSSLVNVGEKWIRGVEFANPLSKYKRTPLTRGDRIEQTQLGLAKAYGYSRDRDYLEKDLFGREPLETMLAVHRVNRENVYKITIDEVALQRAFFTDFGLSDFVTEMMQIPAVSDEVDEFELMVAQFRNYYDRDGFFIEAAPDVTDLDSDAAAARQLTRRVRALASRLRFVSRHYNAAKMPVAAKPDSLVLYVTPEAQAAVDVEALAAAFNTDKADMPFRTEVIPAEKLNIPGVQAILTTDDFLLVADTFVGTRMQPNAMGLHDNHFYHHQGIISVNPFVPAILFSSADEPTVITVEETPVTGMGAIEVRELGSHGDAVGEALEEIERSHLYQVTGSATTTPAGGINDGVKLRLIGTTSPLSYIRQDGGLHIGPDETATEATVQAIALDTDEQTVSVTVTFSDDAVDYWPANVEPPVEAAAADSRAVTLAASDEPEKAKGTTARKTTK